MKLRWTIILILINLFLFWGIVQQVISPPSVQSFNNQVRSFLPLSRSDWDGLGVTTPTGAWKTSKDRWGHWWLKAPYDWPAKTGLIARMNGYLAALEIDSSFVAAELGRVGQSLRSYGLDTPKAVIEVSSGAKTFSYKVGNTTPLGNKVYVMSSDEKEIWVVDAGLMDYLGYTPAQLKQEGFFPFNIIELESMDLNREAGRIRFERKTGSSAWQLKLDERVLPLKPGAWESWLMSMSSTAMTEATAAQILQMSLQAPAGRLSFQTLYGRRDLILGELDKSGDRRWVQWEGERSMFFVPENVLSVLKPESFLETRPIALNPADIISFDWSNGATILSLRKLESGQWVASSQGNTPADPVAVSRLFEKLCSLEASPALKQAPNQATAAETIRIQAGSQKLELSLIRLDNKTLITGPGDRIIYSTNNWLKMPQLDELLDRSLFIAPPESPQNIIFRSLQSPTAETSFASNSAQLQAFVALIKNGINVKSWVEVAAVPVEAPAYQLDIVLKDHSVTIDLWRSSAGWVGRLSGRAFTPQADLSAWLDVLKSL